MGVLLNVHLKCPHTNPGAWVIWEPWFTGSRDFCELWKYLNHKFFMVYNESFKMVHKSLVYKNLVHVFFFGL
jgi:hypothetical protein